MTDPYIIEAKPPKARGLRSLLESIDSKLDRVLAGGDDGADDTPDGESITFSADPEGLPDNDHLDDESGEGDETPEDGAGTGEGTANVTRPQDRQFAFPSRRETVEV